MKSDLECLVCMLKQAMNTVRIVTKDEHLHREVMNRVAKTIRQTNLKFSPALISKPAYDIVSEVTGVDDPFKGIKAQTNREALKILPQLKTLVDEAHDPLDEALHLAVAGNIIDIGIGHEFDLRQDVLNIMQTKFTIDHNEVFKLELKPGRKLLYLGDNAGEIVFDRVLVEQLLKTGIEITFSVKSAPIINDAMMEDAEIAGLTNLVRVIETGSGDIGINFNQISPEFRQVFETADVILAKGHGNFETCSGLPYNIFFLLKAKCEVVARELGIDVGDIVFKHQEG